MVGKKNTQRNETMLVPEKVKQNLDPVSRIRKFGSEF